MAESCSKCKKKCNESEKVQCDLCHLSIHYECAGISRNEKNVLALKNKKIHFFCDGCDIITIVGTLKSEMATLREEINTLKNELQHQKENNSPQGEHVGVDIRYENGEKLIEELQDRHQRSYNLIVFNIAESTGDTEQDKEQDDLNKVKNIIASTGITDPSNFECYRLGKFNEHKVRPLKLIFSSQKDPQRILNKYRPTNNVYINHDLTIRQRNISYNVRQEFRMRKANGEEDILLKYRGGIPSIVKKQIKN
ncbi:hypothetical protein Zmor_014329 [Zophobas morio]|uniref:Zinc finger PHD-type domain-containing protein n=1 Tax=Zophobas morio TaxID=2755281 RepID=A0AA38MG27_9CUCU|nr:hypothetical protein Zmor_014329 [Zophobas morio]